MDCEIVPGSVIWVRPAGLKAESSDYMLPLVNRLKQATPTTATLTEGYRGGAGDIARENQHAYLSRPTITP